MQRVIEQKRHSKNKVYSLHESEVNYIAKGKVAKPVIKLHTMIDLRGSILVFIGITEGSVHDVNILDDIAFEPGSIYVMDRGYVYFTRLYRIHQAGAFFVT